MSEIADANYFALVHSKPAISEHAQNTLCGFSQQCFDMMLSDIAKCTAFAIP